MKGIVTEETDLHYRVMKRNFVEFEDGTKWEVSTVLLVKEDPTTISEATAILRDLIDDVVWIYETIIFKIEDGERVSPIQFGATSYGYYRSNDSEDIVKAHIQIVALIAENKLTPVEDEATGLQISPAIVTAMTEEDSAIN